jgi:hypothetical protein
MLNNFNISTLALTGTGLMLGVITDAIQAVDYASRKDDRWLMLAWQVITLLVFLAVIKWLVNHINEKDKRLLETEKEHDAKLKQREEEARSERKSDQLEFLAALAEKSSAIKLISEAVEKNSVILADHHKQMTAKHDVELKTMIEQAIALDRAKNQTRRPRK